MSHLCSNCGDPKSAGCGCGGMQISLKSCIAVDGPKISVPLQVSRVPDRVPALIPQVPAARPLPTWCNECMNPPKIACSHKSCPFMVCSLKCQSEHNKNYHSVKIPQVGVPQVGVPQVGVPQVGVPQVGVPQDARFPDRVPELISQVGVPQVGVPQVGVPQDASVPARVPALIPQVAAVKPLQTRCTECSVSTQMYCVCKTCNTFVCSMECQALHHNKFHLRPGQRPVVVTVVWNLIN